MKEDVYSEDPDTSDPDIIDTFNGQFSLVFNIH